MRHTDDVYGTQHAATVTVESCRPFALLRPPAHYKQGAPCRRSRGVSSVGVHRTDRTAATQGPPDFEDRESA